MSLDARAFWVVAPGQGEIRHETVATPSDGDVLVRTRFSGVSRGTESLVFTGHVPTSEYQRMRAPFQQGDFPAPVKYGYASVGQVEAGPDGLVGRLVFALYPHQTRYVVPATAVQVVPDGVPARRAVLSANMETALNGVWDAAVLPGDRVAVVGGGAVGCLAAWLAGRVPGCEVALIDLNDEREAVARALGVGFALPSTATGGADVVLHTSGTGAGLATALALAGDEATVVDLSWYGDQMVTVPLGGAFHFQRLTIKSSQVGRVALAQRQRWTFARRLSLAMSLLADDTLDVLLTGQSAFADLPSAMATLAAGPRAAICHCITYE